MADPKGKPGSRNLYDPKTTTELNEDGIYKVSEQHDGITSGMMQRHAYMTGEYIPESLFAEPDCCDE